MSCLDPVKQKLRKYVSHPSLKRTMSEQKPDLPVPDAATRARPGFYVDRRHGCDRLPLDSPLTTLQGYGFTRGERIRWLQDVKEAKLLCPVQDDNIDAAIAYHRQFDPNTNYPDTLAWFQYGRLVSNGWEGVNPEFAKWTEGAISLLSIFEVESIVPSTPLPKVPVDYS
ncbi:hypothetical protein AJ80_09783 [Polytolypa hystricis UAMH7299]|uniref:Uncharacterized protein n=1 Tax=Polytolypa hystricis (strain UAMH7299) TaxID=1447883 RepID=A0A2B7WJR7_POLH7|nr:hypothetical protein AJ80_09783 [Polytolypa hystricis UAMH7299]